MRTSIVVLLCITSSLIFAQTKECDCSEPLNKDLKTKYSNTNYSNFKNWLFEYLQKDEEARSQMKTSSSANWDSEFSAIIEALPINNSTSADWSQSKENQKFYRLEQLAVTNKYITDEQFDQVLEERLGDNQLNAYKACLEACKILIGDGISYTTGGDLSDAFFIQITFNSKTGSKRITLNGSGFYHNLTPIGNFIFKDKLQILDRQSITQYFKRIDPKKPASFGINTVENVKIDPIVFDALPSINGESIPIGTIVASVLDYDAFLKVNGLDVFDKNDMKKVIWIPCDGRIEQVSKYARYSGGKVPDLRGVFLRGINDYNVSFNGVNLVSRDQSNPENTRAAVFQQDALKKHTHKQVWGQNAGTNGTRAQGNNLAIYRKYEMTQSTTVNSDGGEETRPKNVTVYYYIKIN